MGEIKVKIIGIPYAKRKRRGFLIGPKEWKESVVKQTEHLDIVDYPCAIKLNFILPPDKYPKDFPCGPNIANLIQSLLDILQETVLKNDSLVMNLRASKRMGRREEPGVVITIRRY